jgi:ankyrin
MDVKHVRCWLALVTVCVTSPAWAADLRLVDAVAERDRVAAHKLLDEGVDVNARRADGASALLWAAHWNDAELVARLLRAGADVNAANDHGVTPLALAIENTSTALVERLLAAGANPNLSQTSGLTPLMIAARTGAAQAVRMLLARGASVNAATDVTRQTPLMWAVASRHPDIVTMLLENGAEPGAMSARGFTPLLFAARSGDIESAKLLLAAGARVNDRGSDGTHALPLAVLTANDEFALFLLKQGADPNGALGASGVTALHAAAGDVDIWMRGWVREHNVRGTGRRLDLERRLVLVKALLAHAADPNARIAASAIAYVQGYLRNGAYDLFAVGLGDVAGATPLAVAAYSMNTAGIFPGVRDYRVDSSPAILRALLQAGADPGLRTKDESTPLMMLVGCGRFTYNPGARRSHPSPSTDESARILVEEGHVDVNATNEADFTALHCAAYGGFNEVVQYLVERGANINARDWRGRTPYRLAEGAKQSFQFHAWPDTADLLRRLGADTSLSIPGNVMERAREIATQNQ